VSEKKVFCRANDCTLQSLAYALAAVDALIYVFSPQWCCLLLRLVQV